MGTQQNDSLKMLEQGAPATPAANFVEIYVGADHHPHSIGSDGLDRDLVRSPIERLYAAANFR